MIIDTLNNQIVAAMKAHDEIRLSTLKLLSSEIHNYQIDNPNMSQEEELAVIRKEAKKRQDAIEAYKKANLEDRVKQEEAELKVLQEFLPAQVADDELQKIVESVLAESKVTDIGQMGRVIGLVMQKTKGNADGGKVAQLVRQQLQG